MLEIRTLNDASLADVIHLYNCGVERNPWSGWLDEGTWNSVIASKFYYDPGKVLLAYEGKQALGYVHLCHGPNTERTAPDPSAGSIEAFFFDPARPDAAAALLEAALRHHHAQGSRSVLAWSSFSGYPLYRGLYGGLEPMAFDDDRHVIQALLTANFAYRQHSAAMAGQYQAAIDEPHPKVNVDVTAERWWPQPAWEAATWTGLEPYRLRATMEGREVGTCHYAMLPAVFARYGRGVGCIGELHTDGPWQRQGIAAYLVAKAINDMIARGARRITLVTQHDNTAAQTTYRRMGMEIATHTCAFVHQAPGP